MWTATQIVSYKACEGGKWWINVWFRQDWECEFMRHGAGRIYEHASVRLSDSSIESNLLDNPCLYGGCIVGAQALCRRSSYNAPSARWAGDMIISLQILQQMTALSHPCWSKLPKTPQTRISWSHPGNNWFNLCLWQLYLEAQVYLWQQLFVIGCPVPRWLPHALASWVVWTLALTKDGGAVQPRWIFTFWIIVPPTLAA